MADCIREALARRRGALELPRLHLASPDRQARLERWARFLRATTVEEFEELAREDAVMTTAKNILEELSGDSEAQRLADERETAILMHRHLMTTSFEHGEAKGLRIAIHSMCGLLGIELDTSKSAWISGLDAEQLMRVVKLIESERKVAGNALEGHRPGAPSHPAPNRNHAAPTKLTIIESIESQRAGSIL